MTLSLHVYVGWDGNRHVDAVSGDRVLHLDPAGIGLPEGWYDAGDLPRPPKQVRYSPDQPRDDFGRWTDEGGSADIASSGSAGSSDTDVAAERAGLHPIEQVEAKHQIVQRVTGTDVYIVQHDFDSENNAGGIAVGKVTDTIRALPKDHLRAAGELFVLPLKEVNPEHYPVQGTYHPSSGPDDPNSANIYEYYRTPDGKRRVWDTEQVTTHEFAHALDAATGHKLSEGVRLELMTGMAAEHSDPGQPAPTYYISNDHEAFAETYSALFSPKQFGSPFFWGRTREQVMLRYPSAVAKVQANLKAAGLSIASLKKQLVRYSPDQPRDDHGRWTEAGGDAGGALPEPTGGTHLHDVEQATLTNAAGQRIKGTDVVVVQDHFGGEQQNASSTVVRQVTEAIRTLPMDHLKAVGTLVVHPIKELDPKQPPAQGIFQPAWPGDLPAAAYIAEQYQTPNGPRLVMSPEQVAAHEFGHALHQSLGIKLARGMRTALATDYLHQEPGATTAMYFIMSDSEACAETYSALFAPKRIGAPFFSGSTRDEVLRRYPRAVARLQANLKKAGLTSEGLKGLELRYSPDQPRVPAGNPDGGQFTEGGGGGAGGGAGTEARPVPPAPPPSASSGGLLPVETDPGTGGRHQRIVGTRVILKGGQESRDTLGGPLVGPSADAVAKVNDTVRALPLDHLQSLKNTVEVSVHRSIETGASGVYEPSKYVPISTVKLGERVYLGAGKGYRPVRSIEATAAHEMAHAMDDSSGDKLDKGMLAAAKADLEKPHTIKLNYQAEHNLSSDSEAFAEAYAVRYTPTESGRYFGGMTRREAKRNFPGLMRQLDANLRAQGLSA